MADIHDKFSLEIKDPGWQEASTDPEDMQDEEPTLQLTRVDGPKQRVLIDTGPTGPSMTDTHLLPDLTGLQVSQPTAVTIGGTSGLQVDLVPTKSTKLSVPAVPGTGYQLEPGDTYRLIVTQFLGGDESAIKLILISGPTSTWRSYLALADKVVQTLRFE